MKLIVTMVGVCRPSSKRIIQNISNNILFFKNNYPQHIFDFIICSYKNENYNDVLNYCEENKIKNYFIEPIKDSDIPKELILPPPNNNRYRLFYSMDYIMNKIEDCDGVIRIRIDTEIIFFELFDSIKSNTYYTIIDTHTSCSDNIGYSKLEVMKKVWDLRNCFVKAFNSETLVYNCIINNSYSIQQFKFNYILYQNTSEFFNGIRQWSRRNRQWIYDGNNYINGKTVYL